MILHEYFSGSTTDKRMEMNSTFARGPILLFVSLYSFLLPILRAIKISITFELFVKLTFLSLGLYLTISDYTPVVKSHLKHAKEQIQNFTSKIVLDSTLRAVFSLDGSVGLLGGVVGSFTGLIGTYTVPFSEEHRVQLIQSCLPAHIDAKKILFTPGGFWDLLPEHWRDIVVGNENKQTNNISNEVGDESGKCREHHGQHYFNDLSWDSGTPIEGQETETDSLTEEGPCVNSPTTITTTDPKSPIQQQQQQYSPIAINVDEQNLPTALPLPADPIEALQNIATSCLTKLCDSILQQINTKQVRGIGITAALALTMQLKSSRTARKMMWNACHVSISVGLISTIMGSLLTLKTKQQFMDMFQKEIHDEHNSNSISSERGSGQQVRQQRLCSRVYSNSIMNIEKVRFAIFSLRNDEKLRRKLQGLLAIIVLYYFRRRRRIQSLPRANYLN
jgi:hypothetical protein